MVSAVRFFESAEDLEALTGLTHDELWDHGFNLDDMDWGFSCPENFVNEHDEIEFDIPYWAYSILTYMANHCAGLEHVEYKHRHYYCTYHAQFTPMRVFIL